MEKKKYPQQPLSVATASSFEKISDYYPFLNQQSRHLNSKVIKKASWSKKHAQIINVPCTCSRYYKLENEHIKRVQKVGKISGHVTFWRKTRYLSAHKGGCICQKYLRSEDEVKEILNSENTSQTNPAENYNSPVSNQSFKVDLDKVLDELKSFIIDEKFLKSDENECDGILESSSLAKNNKNEGGNTLESSFVDKSNENEGSDNLEPSSLGKSNENKGGNTLESSSVDKSNENEGGDNLEPSSLGKSNENKVDDTFESLFLDKSSENKCGDTLESSSLDKGNENKSDDTLESASVDKGNENKGVDTLESSSIDRIDEIEVGDDFASSSLNKCNENDTFESLFLDKSNENKCVDILESSSLDKGNENKGGDILEPLSVDNSNGNEGGDILESSSVDKSNENKVGDTLESSLLDKNNENKCGDTLESSSVDKGNENKCGDTIESSIINKSNGKEGGDTFEFSSLDKSNKVTKASNDSDEKVTSSSLRLEKSSMPEASVSEIHAKVDDDRPQSLKTESASFCDNTENSEMPSVIASPELPEDLDNVEEDMSDSNSSENNDQVFMIIEDSTEDDKNAEEVIEFEFRDKLSCMCICSHTIFSSDSYGNIYISGGTDGIFVEIPKFNKAVDDVSVIILNESNVQQIRVFIESSSCAFISIITASSLENAMMNCIEKILHCVRFPETSLKHGTSAEKTNKETWTLPHGSQIKLSFLIVQDEKDTFLKIEDKVDRFIKFLYGKFGDEKVKKMSQATAHSYLCVQEIEDSSTHVLSPKEYVILKYPPIFGMEIRNKDIDCLRPQKLLNDIIIEFYLKYVYNEKLSKQHQEQTYVFSSLFYEILSSTFKKEKNIDSHKGWTKVMDYFKSCTKNVDIFSKDFIFIPVNVQKHWYMVAMCFIRELWEDNPSKSKSSVCMPSEKSSELSERMTVQSSGKQVKYLYPERRKPCICFFDSNDTRSALSRGKNMVACLLKKFLEILWKSRSSGKSCDWNKLLFLKAACPQQKNGYDCGLFTLQFFESFFRNPIPYFDYPLPDLENWFPETCTIQKRTEIKNVINSLQAKQTKTTTCERGCR